MTPEFAFHQLTPCCPSCGACLAFTVPQHSTRPAASECPCGWKGKAIFYERQGGSDPQEITRVQLAESLLFFRRRLTQKIICSMIHVAGDTTVNGLYMDAAQVAEDLANAICERLAARETGDPKGYGTP